VLFLDELTVSVYGVSEGSISVVAEGGLSGLSPRGYAQPYVQVRKGAGLRNLTGPERAQIGEPGEEIYNCDDSKVRKSYTLVNDIFCIYFCELVPTLTLVPCTPQVISSYVEKAVQLHAQVLAQNHLRDLSKPTILVLCKKAGAGYPKGIGPYKVAVRFFPAAKIALCVRTITAVSPCKYFGLA
jgi:hypothetical protein